MRGLTAGLLALLLAGAALAEVRPLADPDNPAQVALGQQVYDRACASCHGKALEGQPNWQQRKADGRLPAPPHDETGHTWHHPDDLLFKITKIGPAGMLADYESDMPGFANQLTDDEIWAALAYIKSTWPPVLRQRHEALNRQSR